MDDVKMTAKKQFYAITIDVPIQDSASQANRALLDRMMLEMDSDILYGVPGMESISSPPSLWSVLTARRPGLRWTHRLNYLRCLIRGHRFEKMVNQSVRRPHMRIWCPSCEFEVYRRNDP